MSPTILIIEDDKFISGLLEAKIKADGLNVLTCSDGTSGLSEAVKNKPSLILLDLLLPGDINGLQVLTNLRSNAETKEIPVIVLTNLENKEYIEQASEQGINFYLIKAYSNLEDIILKIKNTLGIKLKEKKESRSKTGERDKNIEYIQLEAAKKLKTKIEKVLVLPEEISIINLVDDLVEYGFLLNSSDIHIEPTEEKILIRFRIDGVMHDIFIFPKSIQQEIITRIKILAGLRTDEHQAAQDGRFKIRIKSAKAGYIDIRVSIAPTYYGENCVMRLLSEQSQEFSLEGLGFAEDNLKRIYRAIQRPYGMILATGPTGSGKTTCLYAILKKLNTKEVSIITIEDPIEYSLEGIDQIQVNSATGLTFAHGLRFILRQDPDIIMVGEIRDDETAGIAVNAAMTGHLLLSTIHANDAATTLPRLIDMGVEPFLITSTVNIVINQRLVRMICENCKTKRVLSDVEFERLREFISPKLLANNHDFYVGAGCEKCEQSGFKSRIGIHETLVLNDEIRNLIMRQSNAAEIREAAKLNGMLTLLEDGFQKALRGLTTIEEVIRVSHE